MPRNYSFRRTTSTQIHLTGRDLLEMQRQEAERQRLHDETTARLRADFATRKAAHLGTLSGPVLWLYRAPVAIAALAVYALLLVIVLASPSSSALGSVALFLVLVATIALAVLDWSGVTSAGERINWPLLKHERPGLYWWAVAAAIFFFVLPVAAYLVYAAQSTGAMREVQRAHLQEEIARLEAQVHPELQPPA